MDYSCVIYIKEGTNGWIILNRPDSLNAFNTTLGEEAMRALAECERDEDIRVVIITGAGRAFCAGDDLKTPAENPLPDPVRQYLEGTGRWPRLAKMIRGMPKPVIAMVNGHAHGAGFDISLACDFRIASQDATFCQAYILRGLASGTSFLPRYVGIGKATEMLFTGQRLSAKEAEALGLVNKVAPAAELESVTREFAEQLAQGPTKAMALVKRALHRGWNADLDQALELQAIALTDSLTTEDAKEGRQAFREKRPPKFRGR